MAPVLVLRWWFLESHNQKGMTLASDVINAPVSGLRIGGVSGACCATLVTCKAAPAPAPAPPLADEEAGGGGVEALSLPFESLAAEAAAVAMVAQAPAIQHY